MKELKAGLCIMSLIFWISFKYLSYVVKFKSWKCYRLDDILLNYNFYSIELSHSSCNMSSFQTFLTIILRICRLYLLIRTAVEGSPWGYILPFTVGYTSPSLLGSKFNVVGENILIFQYLIFLFLFFLQVGVTKLILLLISQFLIGIWFLRLGSGEPDFFEKVNVKIPLIHGWHLHVYFSI